jgi:hypothetical protein
MLTNYEQLRQIFTEAWGIPVNIETKTEAMRAAVQYKTHYMGRNFEDVGYKRETLFDIVGCKLPDAHNDHKKQGAAAGAAAGEAAAGGPAAAAASSSGSAGASSSSGGGGRSNAAAAAAPGSGRPKKLQQQQEQLQQQMPPGSVISFDETDEGLVINFPGSGGPTGQQQQEVRHVHCTLNEHIRQRTGVHGWVQVLGAVSIGRVTQQQVQQLSEMVQAL